MTGVGVAALPPSLLVGVLLGVLGSLGAVGLFVFAQRRWPSTGPTEGYSGESRRRTEFRDYLRAIDEPFAEDHPVAGQPVAFYLPARDVAITFDARAYYRILRSETEPVLVEHEMPGSVLGARLPFETPEVDFGPTVAAEPDPIGAAFAELGVPVDSPVDEVKRAYRRRVKDAHPDQGGDEDAFRRLREAYATAKQHAEAS